MNYIKEKRLKEFDICIKKEMRDLKTRNPKICESYYMKQIFLETIDFNIDDWRELRHGDYYEKKQRYYEKIDKKKFVLQRVLEYKRKLI